MAGKRRKAVAAASSDGQVARDPLAFIAIDKTIIRQVRQAVSALDRRKNAQPGHVRQFINKVRKAVTPPPAAAAEGKPAQ